MNSNKQTSAINLNRVSPYDRSTLPKDDEEVIYGIWAEQTSDAKVDIIININFWSGMDSLEDNDFGFQGHTLLAWRKLTEIEMTNFKNRIREKRKLQKRHHQL
jgi:hypothetical protein